MVLCNNDVIVTILEKLVSDWLDFYCAKFEHLKANRHSSYLFVAISSLVALCGIFIGQKLPGVYIFYLGLFSIISVPMIFAENFLRAVKKIEAESEITVTIEETVQPSESEDSEPIQPYTERFLELWSGKLMIKFWFFTSELGYIAPIWLLVLTAKTDFYIL